ncbi:hypothetical protein PG995_010549 [Apiospora arundinis]
MRLINVKNLQLHEFYEESRIPKYAILSHTWSVDEVGLQEFEHLSTGGPNARDTRAKNGYLKIVAACSAAEASGLEWCWVDTCCIDKKSSAELSEAINSMFKWYSQSRVCMVYLNDMDVRTEAQSEKGEFPIPDTCRWFTRGWCLQELIAPQNMMFYDKEWNAVATKTDVSQLLSEKSGIPQSVLDDPNELSSIPVACRLAWASKRQTTRVEDQAYCLLGIFDINMPLLYGEGSKAFIRLQEQILQHHGDLSLFAWVPDEGQHKTYMDMFAPSTKQFAHSYDTYWTSQGNFHTQNVCSVGSRGVHMTRTRFQTRDPQYITEAPSDDLSLGCSSKALGPWILSLRMVGSGVYVRLRHGSGTDLTPGENWTLVDHNNIFIVPRINRDVLQSIESYHRASICIAPSAAKMARFAEAGPVEAFDFAGQRFLARDIFDFRAHIKFVPDYHHPEDFCIILMRLKSENINTRTAFLYMLPSKKWRHLITRRLFTSVDAQVHEAISLAGKPAAEATDMSELRVGRYTCYAHLHQVEIHGEPAYELITHCQEEEGP